jgi:hypothetical protein
MALNFANNNSLSAITTLPASISGGAMTLISEQTASSSATIDFTSGIDSTYDSYVFKFYDIHPSTNRAIFQFQADTGTNTNYNITITSTYFNSYHKENDGGSSLAYNDSHDDAQSTSFSNLTVHNSNDNDSCASGTLQIFNPSNTTFVKHFISNFNHMYTETGGDKYSWESFKAGYFNITTALTRFRFKYDTGNIDSGVIKLYGIS